MSYVAPRACSTKKNLSTCSHDLYFMIMIQTSLICKGEVIYDVKLKGHPATVIPFKITSQRLQLMKYMFIYFISYRCYNSLLYLLRCYLLLGYYIVMKIFPGRRKVHVFYLPFFQRRQPNKMCLLMCSSRKCVHCIRGG